MKNFPKDFEYVLGLQEASVVAMADGFSQATNKPALVNLHTAAGTGNGMCNIMTAYQNKTPLIITAGQQTREMILCEPYLTNRDETTLPRPWVKWAYQPVRAQDVPAAIMRAYAIALQPQSGPVYVSIPLDDWDRPAHGDAVVRTVSSRYAPDPERISLFAERIRKSKNPALVYGPEIDRSSAWDAGVKFLENTPNVPGLDLPGLDIVSAARGFGCAGVLTRTKKEIKETFGAALSADGPMVIVIPIAHEDRPLVPPVSD